MFKINLIETTYNYVCNSLRNNLLDLNKSKILAHQARGLRYKESLNLRCLHCRYEKRDERWWVVCDAVPKHNQIQKIEDYRTKWIVTHRTRGGRPFQKHKEAYICNTCPPGPYDYKKKIWEKELIEQGKLFPKLKSFNYIS